MADDANAQVDVLEFLVARGLDSAKLKRTKFIRHQGDKGLIAKLLLEGQLEEYQRYQKKSWFESCDYIVSFVGDGSSHARLFGVFEVDGYEAIDGVPAEYRSGDNDPSVVRFKLTRVPEYERGLRDRLVIDWGKGQGLAWHQHAKQKEVVQLLPFGFVEPWRGFYDFILPFRTLCRIIDNPRGNAEWKTALSSMAGIYLIVDTLTGDQYIGSAYGKEGIWGRWTTYRKTGGHGDNKMLRQLLEDKGAEYANNLQFTLLRTLSRSLTNKEVIAYETQYKEKLGTKAFGLNAN